ncbi:hypothetical protein BDV96DRAFT_504071 [Lophiotrema nucula]|uniref:Uncharacterized protein n=1 Tax=Lophiotrema nucula TaxID=690887 RepID=A0A6A5YN66_9PLEO|nr:hypothetical protein BDV96DRAFT_504071 [Lophiotrema nucula]
MDDENGTTDSLGGEEIEEPKSPPKSSSLKKGKRAQKPTTPAQSLAKGINLTLPPLSDIQSIFSDQVLRASGLGFDEASRELEGRPLHVATMCSGTESPLVALQLISESLVKRGDPALDVQHHFSAEIDAVKQGFIERNYQPKILFRDVREFIPKDATTATTAYGAEVDIPGQLDILIAGFVCKDLSRLNSRQKSLEDGGESGDTFNAVYSYTKNFRPSVVLIENVMNTNAFWNTFEAKWNRIGYTSEWLICDTKDYYLPQTRNRMYMIAINKDLHGPGAEDSVKAWKEVMVKLRRPCSSPFSAFLSEDTTQSSHIARASEVNWDLCKLRYDRIRSEERLGNKRPLTQWAENGTVHPPDVANHQWYRSQTSRVWDAIDIAYLQAARAGFDALYKTAVWDVSQNVDRFKAVSAKGIVPCITPTGCDFVTNRQSALGGGQLLSLQGMPYDKLLFANESQREQQDLAGNAMTTTVIGASLIASLITSRKAFRAVPIAGSPQAAPASVQNFRLAPFVPKRMIETKLISPHLEDLNTEELLQDARCSSRLCTCEGSKHLSKASIHVCRSCRHTGCSECAGNPRHAYAETILRDVRKSPIDFERKWRKQFPARIRLDKFPNMSASISKANINSERMRPFMKRVTEARLNAAIFTITNFRRQDNCWKVLYDSSEATMELLIKEELEWRVFVKCPVIVPGDSSLRAMLAHPIARGIVSGSLLDPAWELWLPRSQSVSLTLTDSHQRVSSWRSRLGLPEYKAETIPMALEVRLDSNCATAHRISGLYLHQPNCGTAESSLYMKSGEEPVYLFLQVDPIGPAHRDQFVFSKDCRSLSYGETCTTLALLDPSWRPWKVEDLSRYYVNATVPGKWIQTATTMASVMTPVISRVPVDHTEFQSSEADCSQAITLLDVKLPDHADLSAFSNYSWALEQARIQPSFSDWNRHDLDCSKDFCKCAPAPPRTLWYVDERGTVTAQEDRKGAAIFERIIKTRPPIVGILPVNTLNTTRVQITVNIASLLHRAKRRLDAFDKCRTAWRIITNHIAPAWEPFKKFQLQSNTNEPYDGTLNLRSPLYDGQLRSLAWMRRQESGVKLTVQEVEEEVHTEMGWRVEARAEADVLVRGGVLADLPSFGKTVTTIGLIQSEFESKTPHDLVEENSRCPCERPNLIELAATLIICPPHIAKQWREELVEFLGSKLYKDYNVLLIENVSHLQRLTIKNFQQARVVVVSWNVLGHEQYITRLAQFSAMPVPASTKGRAFDTWLDYTIEALPERIARLKSTPISTFIKNTKTDVKRRFEHADFQGVLPLKIRHGSAYQSFEQMTSNQGQRIAKTKDKAPVHNQAPRSAENSDWIACVNPVLQLFRFNRKVVDEYHYLYEKTRDNYPAYVSIQKMAAHKSWALSGTPALENFSDINQIASLLGVTLGRHAFGASSAPTQLEKRLMADQTNVEKFLNRTETLSYQWHEARHERAQTFLDHFVRQNEAQLGSIESVELLRPVDISIGQRVVYLELSQHLIAQRMSLKKLNDRSNADRVDRLNDSLNNSNSAEEALLKAALVFETPEGSSGLDLLDRKRKSQIQQTEADISRLFKEAEHNQKCSKHLEQHYDGFKRDLKAGNVLGDSKATSILRRQLNKAEAAATLSKGGISQENERHAKLKTFTSQLRNLAQELTMRIRSSRFIDSIQSLLPALSVPDAALMKLKCSSPSCAGSVSNIKQMFLIYHCGHKACDACLSLRTNTEACIDPECDVCVQPNSLIKASDLGYGKDGLSSKDFGKKIHGIQQLVKNIPADDQALVFVPEENAMDVLEIAFQYYEISYYAVSRGRAEAARQIEDFKSNKDPNHRKKVLILNLLDESASGTNLVSANHVIFVSPLAAESQYQYDSSLKQAIARCHRYRQEKKVFIYHFAALGTIDVDILERYHKRFDAVYTSDNENFPKDKDAKRSNTKLVRNAAGLMMLIPVGWLMDEEKCKELELDPERLDSFGSLINFSAMFPGGDDNE